MRLGWLIPPTTARGLVAAKHDNDLGCPAMPQLVPAHLLATGEFDRHLRLVRPAAGPGATPCSAG
jgi:GntR family transcriptional regulator/MocR family aminotransferase